MPRNTTDTRQAFRSINLATVTSSKSYCTDTVPHANTDIAPQRNNLRKHVSIQTHSTSVGARANTTLPTQLRLQP